MRRVLFVFALLFLGLSVNGGSRHGKGQNKMVEGTWMPVEAELGGQEFPEAVLKTMKLAIEDGKYTVNVGAQIDKGTVKIAADTKPQAMDITGTE